MNTTYRFLFARAFKAVNARNAAHEADREDWYASGSGARPDFRTNPATGRTVNYGGNGWRYPECVHGVSTWVDYDCACWQCEESLTPMQEARNIARDQMSTLDRRQAALRHLPLGEMPDDLRMSLLQWVYESLTD